MTDDTIYCPICDTPLDAEKRETPHLGEKEAYSASAWCPLCKFGWCERQPSPEEARQRLAWFFRDYLPLNGSFYEGSSGRPSTSHGRWKFNGEHFWMPPDAVPDILGELLMLVQWKARADGADELGPGRVYGGPEHEGRYAGITFRIQELFYDGLHGLGPVGEIRRKCG